MRLEELETKRASDYRKANPIGDIYLDAPEDEINYMLKKSEKEGIADWHKKYEVYFEKRHKESQKQYQKEQEEKQKV